MEIYKNYFLLIFFSLFISSCITGSSDKPATWEKQFDLNPHDNIIQLSSGGFITAGFSEVMKLNSYGAEVWSRDLSDQITKGDYNFRVMEIIEIDNGFAVAGYSPKENRERIAMYIELNSEGDVVSQKALHEGFTSEKLTFKKTGNGYLLASAFGDTQEPKTIRTFVLDSSGSITDQISYELPNSKREFIGAIIILNDNSGFVIESTLGNPTEDDITTETVTKLNSNMQKVWSTNFGSPEDNDVKNINDGIEANDGGYIFAGVHKFGWCVKVSEDGEVLWQNRYEQPNLTSQFYDINRGLDGGYVLVGVSHNTTNSKDDAGIYKISNSGELEWNNYYGYTHFNDARSITATADGGYIFTGTNANNPSGHDKGWVLKLDSNGKL